MKSPKKREFGKVPDWALKGNVTLRNYDLRAEFHMANSTKSFTPYLRLPGKIEEGEEIADYIGWMQYFMLHLGGFSRQVRMFVEEQIGALNVPEQTPEEFDPMFKRRPVWAPPHPEILAAMQWRERADRCPPLGKLHNVFVPMFAPQYAAMVERGGKPGFSLEDEFRRGVWVPLEWLGGSERLGRRP